jgi:hypothetical protein
MMERCSREKNQFFKHYGGRGIGVCERWKSFQNFLADMGEPPEGMSLDRYPDCDGNYEPGNCRWATNNEQQNNKRNNHRIEIDGESKTVADWCRDRALPYGRVASRLKTGWTDRQALGFDPPPKRHPNGSTKLYIDNREERKG